MATASAPAPRVGVRLFRGAAVLGFVLAIAALVMLAAGPLGWRAGWWPYRVGLQTLMPYAGYVGVAGMAISALALMFGARTAARRGIILAVLGFLIGGTVAYLPWHWNNLRGAYPRLNDVTTDLDNPPSLVFAEGIREAELGNPVAYGGAESAAVQKKSYPGTSPRRCSICRRPGVRPGARGSQGGGLVGRRGRPPPPALSRPATAAAGTALLTILRSASRPRATGSRVDIRSGARQGRGDFGVNATRVRGFLAALRAAAQIR